MLGVGVGASTSTLRLLDDLLLRPPSGVSDPSSVFRVDIRQLDSHARRSERGVFSYGEYLALEAIDSSAATLAAYTASDSALIATLGRDGPRTEAQVAVVSPGYFDVLGAVPVRGRAFASAGVDAARSDEGVILGYDAWIAVGENMYAPVGTRLEVNGRAFTLLGVMPPGFVGVDQRPANAWIALTRRGDSTDGVNAARSGFTLNVIARAKSGVSSGHLRGALTSALLGPDAGDLTVSHRQSLSLAALSAPRWSGGTNAGLPLALLVTVACVALLVTASGNVAVLLLARELHAAAQTAMQVVLGASRTRVVLARFVDGVVTVTVGAILGVSLSVVFDRVFRTYLPADTAQSSPLFHGRALAVDGFVGVGALVCCTLPSVLHSWRMCGQTTLLPGASRGATARYGWQNTLVSIQMSVTLALMIVGGLFARSLHLALSAQIGLRVDRLAYVELSPIGRSGSALPPPISPANVESAEARLRAIAGVQGVAVASSLSLLNVEMLRVTSNGLDAALRLGIGGPFVKAVSSNYFDVVGTPILRGRGIADRDGPGSTRVAVVGMTMARSLWPGADPIGQCLTIGADPPACYTIVGIAADVPVASVREAPTMLYYISAQQRPDLLARPVLLVRVATMSDSSARALAASVAPFASPGIVPHSGTFEHLMEPEIRPWRISAAVIGTFALVALAVASGGLFSVFAYAVERRSREFAIRNALGASVRDVVRLLAIDAARVLGIGVVIGLLTIGALSPVIQPLLYRTSVLSPLVTVISVAAIVSATIPAALMPVALAKRPDLRRLLDAQ